MQEASIPRDDAQRLDSLRRMELLSTPAEAYLDRIIAFASEYFRTPISLFSIVDKDRQWFKSRLGLDVPETPRNISFCGHAILQDDVFVVENANEDPRFSDNPLVVGGPRIGFYAGAPVKNAEGFNIGTLCVIDKSARKFSQRDRARLQDFSWWLRLALEKRGLSVVQLELMAELDAAKRESMLDPMTQTWNRRGFAELAKREIAKARRSKTSIALVMIDIDHFKKINDTYGHPEGDKAIIMLARLLRGKTRTTDVLARLGGEEFAVLMPEISRPDALRLADSLRLVVEQDALVADGQRFTISAGLAWFEQGKGDLSEEGMVALADKALYAAKQSGRNRVVASP